MRLARRRRPPGRYRSAAAIPTTALHGRGAGVGGRCGRTGTTGVRGDAVDRRAGAGAVPVRALLRAMGEWTAGEAGRGRHHRHCGTHGSRMSCDDAFSPLPSQHKLSRRVHGARSARGREADHGQTPTRPAATTAACSGEQSSRKPPGSSASMDRLRSTTVAHALAGTGHCRTSSFDVTPPWASAAPAPQTIPRTRETAPGAAPVSGSTGSRLL